MLRLLVLFLIISVHAFAQADSLFTGIASYYDNYFNGHRTSNGEIFSNNLFTAASKDLPLGCYVKITNLDNGDTAIVKINDRMPLWNPRLIDLAQCAAKRLGFIWNGLAKVTIQMVRTADGKFIQRVINDSMKMDSMHAVAMRTDTIKQSSSR
jgi:rare lipoprotein A